MSSGITGGGGRGRGQGAECPLETSADLSGKKEKGWKLKRKEGKLWKGKVKTWKWKVEKLENEERTPFFFFFFCFSVFKTNFVLGLPKWKFSTGKKHFMLGKNQKKWLPPQKNFSCYARDNVLEILCWQQWCDSSTTN